MKVSASRVICLLAAWSGIVDAAALERRQAGGIKIFPAHQAKDVNPDTHLVLTFASPPKIGTSGKITILDAKDKKVVDELDMKIPTSPNPSGRAPQKNPGSTTAPKAADPNDKTVYQKNIVGGIDFHFFPIIVRNNTATITLHNGKLQYGASYILKMEKSILSSSDAGWKGYEADTEWTFTTKAAGPAAGTKKVVVAEDGSGDFNTVQGAIDWAPAKSAKRTTIFIKNGHYEEIVFLSKKNSITIRGESREGVVVGYPNNSAFNPSKGGPSRRVAFTISSSNDIQLSSFTIKNYFIGQAEALLSSGKHVIIDHMTLNGSGDAFTTRGTIYFVDSKLTGDGDTVLGYGAVFYLRSQIDSIGPITWTRTVKGGHGNIFVNSTLVAVDEPLPWSVTDKNPKGQKSKSVFARLPQNGKGSTSSNFPNAEMVLINTKTSGIPAEGWVQSKDPLSTHQMSISGSTTRWIWMGSRLICRRGTRWPRS